MNKKKKNTRIKHRKNQNRVKKLLQASLLKAKHKNISTPSKVVTKEIDDPIIKKSSTAKNISKKSSAKKATVKKTTAKKD